MEVKRGHPPGLYVIFFSEMWERFSYYGMRALLVLYMTRELLFGDEFAFGVYGAYTALVYATPLFGGMLADRLLGNRKAVTIGATVMALGHFMMVFESQLYLALGLLIVGNGFFKPNMSSMVGRLYEPGDPRRDSGFTIFYMGVNVGALLAPILVGAIGETVGWHYGFGLAGVGMLIGLANFLVWQRRFAGIGDPPDPETLRRPIFAGINREHLVWLGAIPTVGVAWFLVQHFAWIGSLLNGISVLVVLGLIAFMVVRCDATERSRLIVAMVLTAFNVVFWAFFEQAGSSMTLFTDRNVDRTLLDWEIPASVFQSVNPVFIVLLGGPFSALWIALARRHREPSTPVKFGLGIFQLGLGFGALWWGAVTADDGVSAMFWLLLGYLLHTTGELCISPVGLSMITKLSPARIVAMMMGFWYLSIAYANYAAALIATLTGVREGGEAANGALPPPSATVGIYGDVFGKVALVAMGVGVFVMLISPLLRRGMRGIH